MKLLFAPVGIVAGLLAGFAARKAFELIWKAVDREEPPDPSASQATYGKLVPALLVEGAVFRVVKGMTDHATRAGFARYTGRWPG